MIRLYRGAEPPELAARKVAWTSRWTRILATGSTLSWITRVAKEALKSGLRALSFGKCAYCEGELGAQAREEIEHYIAKTVNPAFSFEWTNLFLSCGGCNGSKLDVDHGGSLLKPDDEDPEPYFWVTPEGKLQPHPSLGPDEARRAQNTIEICDLNRGGLQKGRSQVLIDVEAFLSLLPEQVTPEWRRAMEARLQPDFPYKLVVRAALTKRGFAGLAQIDRDRCRRQP